MRRTPILLKDAIYDYKVYKKRTLISAQESEQMNTYFDMLLNFMGNGQNCDLARTEDKKELRTCAITIVMLPKKDCGKLVVSDVQRAKFFNGFVDFVTDTSVFKRGKVRLEKIPFVMNELERKIDIVKHFREYEKLTQEEIGDIYYVGEKTIRNDLREIREGYLNAFGQKIDIGYDFEQKNLFSTAVPLFLAQNITQIVAMLNGLGMQREDYRYSCYAEATATNIWRQLSRPVRDRIMNDLVDALHLDREWYEFLDSGETEYKAAYYHERNIATNLGNILMFFKNGMRCTVLYDQDNQTKVCENTRITDSKEEYFEVEDGTLIRYEKLIDIRETGN